MPDAVRDLRSGAEQGPACGDIQPGFVDTEGLHHVRILLVQTVQTAAEFPVFFMLRREQHQIGAFTSGLPDGFCGDDAAGLCGLIFGQNNSMTKFRIAADGYRHIPELRMIQKLDGCEKTVDVTM